METRQVRTAILVAPRDVQVVTRPGSPLDPGEVRVAVEQCGICDSDVRRWAAPADGQPRPLRLGHEIAGKVIEVGGRVKGRAVGDRVAVWAPSKRTVGGDGLEVRGLAEEVVADARHCFPVGGRTRFAFLAEPLARLMMTLSFTDQIHNEDVVIVGGGFKALLATMLIAQTGEPRSLTVVSSRPDSVGPAGLAGATHTASPGNLRSVVALTSNRRGADIAFDLSGTQQGLDLAPQVLRDGGEVVFGYGVAEPLELNYSRLTRRRISSTQGDHADNALRLRWMEPALALLDSGFDPGVLVGSSFPLERTAEAFEEAERGVHKVFVTA